MAKTRQGVTLCPHIRANRKIAAAILRLQTLYLRCAANARGTLGVRGLTESSAGEQEADRDYFIPHGSATSHNEHIDITAKKHLLRFLFGRIDYGLRRWLRCGCAEAVSLNFELKFAGGFPGVCAFRARPDQGLVQTAITGRSGSQRG
jgi:hypothetical protein